MPETTSANPPKNDSAHHLKHADELATTIKSRHISMIAIGGIIGAGLFVGSGHAINLAGPAVILAFILAGFIVLCICQTLGELTASWPGKGSFAHYCSLAFGATFGELIGWLYWWFWVLIIPVESVASGQILAHYTAIPQWIWTLLIICVIGSTNLLAARIYAESEFFLSLLKIISIVIFLIIGLLAICGVFPHSPHGMRHLWVDGIFPNGFSGAIAAFLIAITSYCGSESTSLIAAESDDPIGNLKKALRSIMFRVLIFYIGTLVIACSLVKYNTIDSRGTFVTVFDVIGIKHTRIIVDVIVFIALLSCLSSAFFVASRMLFNLAATECAPGFLSRVTNKNVPKNSIIFSGAIGLIGVLGSFYFPNTIFLQLINSSGTIMLIIYASLALSQIRLRKKAMENHQELSIKMWFHPWLALLVVGLIIVSILWMLTLADQQIPVLLALIIAAVFAVGIFIKNKCRPNTC